MSENNGTMRQTMMAVAAGAVAGVIAGGVVVATMAHDDAQLNLTPHVGGCCTYYSRAADGEASFAVNIQTLKPDDGAATTKDVASAGSPAPAAQPDAFPRLGAYKQVGSALQCQSANSCQ